MKQTKIKSHFDTAVGVFALELATCLNKMTTNMSEQINFQQVAVVLTTAICTKGQQICHYRPRTTSSSVCFLNNLVT